MAAGFVVKSSSTAFALAANTAATIVNCISGTRALIVTEFGVSFDGVTASAVPVLVELCSSTQAGAGTPGASPTPLPIRPTDGAAAIFTAGTDYTAEPTTVVPLKHWLLTPAGGVLVIQFPLGREISGSVTASAAGKGLLLRLKAPAVVNARAYMEVEE